MALDTTKMIWNGQGPVYFGTYDEANGRKDMGYLTNLYKVGCGNRTLTATPGRETTVIPESCSGQRLALKEIETSKSLQISVEMVQFDGRTLARAFYGEAVTAAGDSVTGEALPLLAPGDYFFLRYPRASALVLTDSTPGSPLSYVKDTHYEEIDADAGIYRLIAHPASNIEPVTAAYTYASHVNIAAFSKASVETGILFDGVNGDGQKCRVIIPRVNLAMTGDFGWIADDASALALGGQALFVDGLSNDAEYGPFMRVNVMPDLPV